VILSNLIGCKKNKKKKKKGKVIARKVKSTQEFKQKYLDFDKGQG
jgi:hypothetical protein